MKDKEVPIFQYIGRPEKGLTSIQLKPLLHLQTLPSELNTDLLWQFGWIFSGAKRLRLNWSCFMQHVFSPRPASNDQVWSSSSANNWLKSLWWILYLLEHDLYSNRQPLWLKATDIVKAKSMNTVCRCGRFHTMISFMGSIGESPDERLGLTRGIGNSIRI